MILSNQASINTTLRKSSKSDNSFIKYIPFLTQLYVKFYLRNNNFKYNEEEIKVVETTNFTIKDDVIIKSLND